MLHRNTDKLLETLFNFCRLLLLRSCSWLGWTGPQDTLLEALLLLCKLLLSCSSRLCCREPQDMLMETMPLFCRLLRRCSWSCGTKQQDTLLEALLLLYRLLLSRSSWLCYKRQHCTPWSEIGFFAGSSGWQACCDSCCLSSLQVCHHHETDILLAEVEFSGSLPILLRK